MGVFTRNFIPCQKRLEDDDLVKNLTQKVESVGSASCNDADTHAEILQTKLQKAAHTITPLKGPNVVLSFLKVLGC
eukprot:12892001-Prorocentrum_lima.AAC.1